MSALEEENEIIFITKMKINNLTFFFAWHDFAQTWAQYSAVN